MQIKRGDDMDIRIMNPLDTPLEFLAAVATAILFLGLMWYINEYRMNRIWKKEYQEESKIWKETLLRVQEINERNKGDGNIPFFIWKQPKILPLKFIFQIKAKLF